MERYAITTGGFRVGPRGPRAPLLLRIISKINNTDIAGKRPLSPFWIVWIRPWVQQWYFLPAALCELTSQILGTFNETKARLHVHHSFWQISLPSLHNYTVKWANFTLTREREQRGVKFYCLFWLNSNPNSLFSHRVAWDNGKSLKEHKVYFSATFLSAPPLLDRKVPPNSQSSRPRLALQDLAGLLTSSLLVARNPYSRWPA